MNLPYAVLDYSIAHAEGAPQNRALMLGLVGGTIKSPMFGVLLAALLGRQQQQAVPLGTTNQSLFGRSRGLFGRRATQGLVQVAPPAVAAATAETINFVPSFFGLSHARAEAMANLFNLTLRNQGDHSGKVETQEPAPGAHIPADREVRLTWRK